MSETKVVTNAPVHIPGAPTANVQPLESSAPLVHPSQTVMETRNSQYPTILVKLPSEGKLYPTSDPLSAGIVEMKYMTAKEEDILTTESYITNGVVLDKLFQSLIVSQVNYDNILIGDRDAIMIAARINGYGELYETSVTSPSGKIMKVSINLNDIPHKKVDTSLYPIGENRFEYRTSANDVIMFKLLTTGDEKKILSFARKVKHGADTRTTNITSRLFNMILSVNGNDSKDFIKLFIENDLKAKDSREFRKYVASIQPGINMEIDVVDEDTGEPFRAQIALGIDFFWPDTGV